MKDEELAKRLGVPIAWVGRMTKEKRAALKRLLMVADLLEAGIIPPNVFIEYPRRKRCKTRGL